MLTESLPQELTELLDRSGTPPSGLLVTTSTDVDRGGSYTQEWLAVSKDRLWVLAGTPEPTVLHAHELAKIEKIRSHAVVGSGFLQARVDGAWIELLRYTNRLSYRFSKLATKLETLRGTGVLEIHPSDEVDQKRCPKCKRALVFAGDVCPWCMERRLILKWVFDIVRPEWRATLVLISLMVIGIAAELVPPKLQQHLVDNVLRVGERGESDTSGLGAALLVIVMTLAGARIVVSVVTELKSRLATRVGSKLTFDLRGRMVEKLQKLPVAYYDRNDVGSLLNRVAHDAESLHGLLMNLTGGILLQMVQLVGIGIMLFTLDPQLAMLTMIPMPLVVLGSRRFWTHVIPRHHQYYNAAHRQWLALLGMMQGVRVVKAFSQEERENARYLKASSRVRDTRMDIDITGGTYSSMMGLIFSLGGLLVWYAGGRQVLEGRMTLGSLMAFLAYLGMFYAPLSALANVTAWMSSFLTASQRVFELLNTPLVVEEAADPRPLDSVEGSIVFDKVSFGYDRHRSVLEDVSFEIKAGEMIGIVGKSGSGKTTLVNLLCRFYDVTEGKITIDGTDVRQLKSLDLRRHVGMVLQDPFHFPGRVWENLTYGRPEASRKAGLAAARSSNVHDFILKLHFGYDTMLGERGAGLSGGERQRLSLARALLYDPRILILDEATSNVDAETEKAIQDALQVLARGRTTLAIAHRLSTLRNSDRIFVFDEGKLIEIGTHRELMEKGGTYSRMVKLQTQVSREPTVDELQAGKATTSEGTTVSLDPETTPEAPVETPLPDVQLEPTWLEAGNCVLDTDPVGRLRLAVNGAPPIVGVQAIRCFPATEPDQWISLGAQDADGHYKEAGIIVSLASFPPASRALVEQALGHRYFMRHLSRIHRMESKFGFLEVHAGSDRGPVEFVIRWSHTAIRDFGHAGKILHDTDDNQYLLPDLEKLPKPDLELYRRFIYW